MNNNLVPFYKRLGAMFYDSILVVTVLFFAAALAFVTMQGDASQERWYSPYLFGVIALFYIGFWVKGGETLGLKAWKLKVVTTKNRPLNWRNGTLRFLTSLICLATGGLGFLWAIIDKENRALNDILSDTKIINYDQKKSNKTN